MEDLEKIMSHINSSTIEETAREVAGISKVEEGSR